MNIRDIRMTHKKKWLIGGCAAGMLILAVGGWNVFAKSGQEMPAVDMVSAKVEKADLSKSIQGTGTLTPENSVELKVPTGVRITEIKVKAGDDVKAGDVLALTDGNTVTAELMTAKEKLAETDKKIRQAKTRNASYYNWVKDRENLNEKINLLSKIAETNSIVATADGTLTAVNGAAGEVGKTTPKDQSGNNSSQNNAGNNSGSASSQNQSAIKNLEGVSRVNLNEITPNNVPVTIQLTEFKMTVPVTGEPQTKEIEETEAYQGTIEWNHPAETFEENTVYAARIKLTAKPGFVFDKTVEPTVEGAAVAEVEYTQEETVSSAAFTVIYPATEAKNQEEKPADEEKAKEPSGTDNGQDTPGEKDGKPEEDKGQNSDDAKAADAGDDGVGDSGSGSWGAGVWGGTASGTSSEGTSESAEGKAVNTELVSVFTISTGDKMKVNIQVDELDILSVTVGQKANITLNALPGQVFEGQITRINKVGTANNGVTKYPVEITAAKNEKMLSGMNVSASVLVEEKKAVLTVPAAAISEESGKSYVYTSFDEKTGIPSGKREVTTGLTDGTNIEIVKGVKEGTDVYYQASSGTDGGTDEMSMAEEEVVM